MSIYKEFICIECRELMLPMILCHLQQLLEMKEELELVIQILSDILMLLHRQDVVSELVRRNLE